MLHGIQDIRRDFEPHTIVLDCGGQRLRELAFLDVFALAFEHPAE